MENKFKNKLTFEKRKQESTNISKITDQTKYYLIDEVLQEKNWISLILVVDLVVTCVCLNL